MPTRKTRRIIKTFRAKLMFRTLCKYLSGDLAKQATLELIHHPEFTLIEVQGHADERSDDNHNLKLTKDRASAVVDSLAQRGVARDHLRSMGYGEYCPLDPGHNEQAWEKNRRVEFKVVKTADGGTGVELGCAKAREKGVVPAPVP